MTTDGNGNKVLLAVAVSCIVACITATGVAWAAQVQAAENAAAIQELREGTRELLIATTRLVECATDNKLRVGRLEGRVDELRVALARLDKEL